MYMYKASFYILTTNVNIKTLFMIVDFYIKPTNIL